MGTEGSDATTTLVTLGPTGTCHERACMRYMEFQGVENYEFEYIRVPPGMSTEWTPEFDAMVRETFMNIVQRRHELGDTMYIDKKSGVRVDV